jgi:quercetin dioxygenase-like cupin family protein
MTYDEDRRVIERHQANLDTGAVEALRYVTEAEHQTMFFNRLTPIGIGPALPPPRWKRTCRRSSLASMTLIEMEPTAVHVGEDELPWVDNDEGTKLKVLVAKVSEGLWIIRTKFAPGVRVQTHKHTGQVYAYTLSGSWKYEESDYVNTAGSFLYEPAGSRHTLVVPETNTEVTDVWFQIYGANLSLDSDGNIERVTDAGSVLQAYVAGCEAMGATPTTILTD